MKRLKRGVALLLGLLVLVAAGRVVLYRQGDDRERVAAKQAYLERIAALPAGPGRPNVVFVLFDDLGFGDLGVYGSSAIRTPNLDRLAGEGALLRHAYSSSPYCSAARAALMTGRYPRRAGLDHVVQAPWTWSDVLIRFGGLNRRLPLEELTLAEVLRAAGYATALVGKWHLGDVSPSLPTERGFDSFFGLLHSNDQGEPPLWRDRDVEEAHPIDQSTLTARYTAEAVAFLERQGERPFFLYLPHTFPHVPLHASEASRGRSAGGLYGDVVEELDDSIGAVLDALERTGLADDTLVIVSSDNGAWFQGSSGPVRGRKFDVFEGGMRVPWIARWPGRVPAGVELDGLAMGIDLLPTVLELAGLPLPADRTIDGVSLVPLLTEGRAVRERVLFFQLGALRAVRRGPYKYHDRRQIFFGNPMNWRWGPMRPRGPWLFDLRTDPSESYDVSAHHPGVAARLREELLAERARFSEDPEGWR